MAVTTPKGDNPVAGIRIDREIDTFAGDFASVPIDMIVLNKENGEIFKKNASGIKEDLFTDTTASELYLYNNFT